MTTIIEPNKQLNDIAYYRQLNAFKFYLKTKYSKLLEFNKQTRDEWRLTNFVKKYVLFNVCNFSESEINEISGIYRFRCHVYEYDEIELSEINQSYEIQKDAIDTETDQQLKQILQLSLEDEKTKQIKNLSKSKKTIKLPVMIDLRVYGPNPDIPICIGDKIFYFDDKTKTNIERSFNLINPNSLSGDRFCQMLNVSKILRDHYLNEITNSNLIKIKK